MTATAANGRKLGGRLLAGGRIAVGRARWAVAALALGALGVCSVACGGDSAESAALTCGPGTVANGGACTPACGAGTTFDATTKTCVAVGGAAGSAGAGGSVQAGAAGSAGSNAFPEGHPCGPVPGAKRIINCNPACGVLDKVCPKFQCDIYAKASSLSAADLPLAIRVGTPLPSPTCTWFCPDSGVTPTRLMILPFEMLDAPAPLSASSDSPGWSPNVVEVAAKDIGFGSCVHGDFVCSQQAKVAKGFYIEPTDPEPGHAIVTVANLACSK